MTTMMKIPIVLWGSHPPSHQITCMTVCNNGIIVTGSLEGQLVFWTVSKTLNSFEVCPQNMIVAHSSSVESLVNINNNRLNINSGIISLADNQELCLWNSETCCCLTSTFLHGRFHSLYVFPCKNSKVVRESILACYGFQEIIYLLDPLTFQVIYILKQRASKCYIRTIRSLSAVLSPHRTEDTLFATTHDGSLIIYKIPPNISLNGEKYEKIEGTLIELNIEPHMTKRSIHSVLVEPINSHYFLLLSVDEIHFYNFKDFKPINKFITDDKKISGAFFINEFSIIFYFENFPPILYIFDTSFNITATHNLSMSCSLCPSVICAGVNKECNQYSEFLLFVTTSASEVIGFRIPKIFKGDTINFSSYSTLGIVWKNTTPTGVATNLTESLDTSVSCSLQLEEYGFMIFGMKNGTIAISNTVDILKRQIHDDRSSNVSTLLLHGHVGAVTCLCHPYDECNKHNPCHLLSGGVDFSVRLWNIVDGTQVKVYYPHGGFIQEIFVLPGDQLSLSNLTVISVASDYSIALINLSYEKAILRTRSHTSPVYSVKWKTKEDSLLVYCTDGTLFVWQITTGNLDRCITGKTAVDIFETNDCESRDSNEGDFLSFLDVVNIDSHDKEKGTPSVFKDLKTKRGFINSHKHIAHVLPTKKNMFQRVLRKMSKKHRPNIDVKVGKDPDKEVEHDDAQNQNAITQALPHTSSACNLASAHQGLCNHSANLSVYHNPFEVLSIRTGHHDSDFHIFLIDFDALISLIIHEEDKLHNSVQIYSKHASTLSLFSQSINKYFSKQSCLVTASKDSLTLNVLTMGLCPTSDLQSYKKYCQTLEDYRSYVLVSTAKLLISCLHPWGLDPELDQLCINQLDFTPPAKPVYFGFMSRHKLQLNIPGWVPKEALTHRRYSSASEAASTLMQYEYFNTHWQMSSVMTAQHLVGLVAITNSIVNIFRANIWEEGVCITKTTNRDTGVLSCSRSMIQKTMSVDSPSGRTFVTTSVPDLSQESVIAIKEDIKRAWNILYSNYSSIVLLMIKKGMYYQPPCIHELILFWLDSYDEIRHASYCMLNLELNTMNAPRRQSIVRSWCLYLPTQEQLDNIAIDDLLKLPTDDYAESGGFFGFWPSDRKYQRTIAIFLICFIICEFPDEFDPLQQKYKHSECVISVPTIILLSNIMSKLIKTMVNVKSYSQYPIRKAFLFFLGRAFSVWQPHVNVSQILMIMLETNAYVELFLQHLDQQNLGKTHQYLQLNDLLNKYRCSLREIMLTNSDVVITVINKEFPRYTASSSYVSMGQSSLAAAVAVTNVRQQNTTLNSQPSRIQMVRKEIVHLIDIMARRRPEQFTRLIVEIIDLLLSCSYHKIPKREPDFIRIFPFLNQFHMVDYCEHTKRLVVGTVQGQFGIYDMKTLRCALFGNYQHPITCLKICPDGRQLVTYCYDEMKLCVWYMQVSMLGILTHAPKPKMSFQLKQKVIKNFNEMRKIHISWTSSNTFKLIFNDESELCFTA